MNKTATFVIIMTIFLSLFATRIQSDINERLSMQYQQNYEEQHRQILGERILAEERQIQVDLAQRYPDCLNMKNDTTRTQHFNCFHKHPARYRIESTIRLVDTYKEQGVITSYKEEHGDWMKITMLVDRNSTITFSTSLKNSKEKLQIGDLIEVSFSISEVRYYVRDHAKVLSTVWVESDRWDPLVDNIELIKR